MNSRFPLLSTLSLAIRILGLILFLSCMATLIHYDIMWIKLVALGGVIISVLMEIIGELVGVAFSIEDNSRRAADNLEKLLELERQRIKKHTFEAKA
jgi:hypothetical protein